MTSRSGRSRRRTGAAASASCPEPPWTSSTSITSETPASSAARAESIRIGRLSAPSPAKRSHAPAVPQTLSVVIAEAGNLEMPHTKLRVVPHHRGRSPLDDGPDQQRVRTAPSLDEAADLLERRSANCQVRPGAVVEIATLAAEHVFVLCPLVRVHERERKRAAGR